MQTKVRAVMDERMSLMEEAIQAISMIKMMAAEAFWHRRIMTIRNREFSMQFKLKLLSLVTGLLQSVPFNLCVDKSLLGKVDRAQRNLGGQLRPLYVDTKTDFDCCYRLRTFL